jgi:predicted phage terminase large subunit-like protein
VLQQRINNGKAKTEDYAFTYLHGYIRSMYQKYDVSIHHLLISKKLMDLEAGIIRRLMIFMPPRHGKTMQVSEYFPAWYLGRNPTHQIIAATYSYERAGDIGRKVRNQLLDPAFNDVFSNCQLSIDSRGANKLSTMQGGNYYSVGVGGAIVGRGAHLFLIDDPIKSREDADSQLSRKRMINWFKSVAYTRLMPDNRIVIIMTRWHFDDLAGYILESDTDHWDILSLPALYDGEEDVCPLTERAQGDALWPGYFSTAALMQIRKNIGTREWNAQYQQRPLDDEGGTFKLNWFKRYDQRKVVEYDILANIHGEPPDVKPFDITQIVISWDTAYKESEINDPSSGTVWGISKMGYYLLYVYNERMAFPKLKRKVISMWERYTKWNVGSVLVLIEDRASGQSLIQVLDQETRIPVSKISPDANKEIRAEETSNIIEGGRVFLPEEAPWLIKYETYVCQFPLGKEDDDVDSTTQFLRWASKPKYKRRKMRFWK